MTMARILNQTRSLSMVQPEEEEEQQQQKQLNHPTIWPLATGIKV